jgi:hypothetical protein
MAGLDRYSGLVAAMDNAAARGLTVHVATRATCAEHLAHGDDKATEPLTAARFGLDVERLRDAMTRIYGPNPPLGWSGAIDRIAAEYARLAASDPQEGPA